MRTGACQDLCDACEANSAIDTEIHVFIFREFTSFALLSSFMQKYFCFSRAKINRVSQSLILQTWKSPRYM